ncbi:DUF2752 domain-containing protein [Allosalinactinospora lopnorensis]|uniref:DUF2752 domain-containing protein n=1 Tax=Allosalinactinospora lopnorensis TaxID=1352348 RepID=UPI000623E701|nr:DUF2752 domain-containing protein [Allosalinactinospora lopnorensis]
MTGTAASIWRRLHPATAPLLLGGAGVAGATLLHFVDPNEEGNYPLCPWLMLTGTYCPGCGTMRAVHALTHLDIAGAAQMNVFLLAALPYFAFAYARWVYRSFRPAPPPTAPRRMPSPMWLYLLVGLIMAFWVVRNLPFGSFLAPG